MAEQSGRTKVAILGGGVAGMVAAFWLTCADDWQDRFEVTVYQSGWRLGGKGASGRNPDHGQRIEEHGLHVWFGFYDNAFLTMRSCYDALEDARVRGPDCPIRTFQEAFRPSPVIGLYEYWDGDWLPHRFAPPRKLSPLHPGLGEEGPLPSLWHVIARTVIWALDRWDELRAEPDIDGPDLPAHALREFLHWSSEFDVDLDEFDVGVRERLLDAAQRATGGIADLGIRHRGVEAVVRALTTRVVRSLVDFKDALWRDVVSPRRDHAGLRLFFTTFDTLLSAVCGLLDSGAVTAGFTSIDGTELSAFLASHGARDFTLELAHSPFLRGWYDAAFAYRFENGQLVPDLAAGTGIHGILRLMGGYRGSVAYKMNAGMGDTIFGPFYEVLRARGVSFEFFREVTALELTDGGTSVGRIRLVRQAEVVGGGPYRPLVTVGGLPCWPSVPDWEQLVDGAALRDAGVAFEHGGRAPDATEEVLTLGREFDTVVLAIPAPALGGICADVAARVPALADMLDHCASTMTQAGQVWTVRDLVGLGAAFGDDAIATSFVEPLDTYCDMSHLLAREAWGDAPPLGVAYVCGVLADQPSQAAADAAAAAGVRDLFARYGTVLWPAAERTDGTFDWSVLHGPAGASDDVRWAAQYVRANYEPTERYVLSPPGGTAHRLAADALVEAARAGGRGVANLYLAGDWTLNGINGGCVEAATMSGMRVARSLGGVPRAIASEHHTWLTRIEQ